MNKNDIIFYFLDLLEVVGTSLKIEKDKNNIYNNYYSKISNLAKNEDIEIILNPDIRNLIEKFILNLNIEKYKNIIFSILNPKEVFAEANEEYIDSLSLSMLNDKQLLKFYALIVGTVNMLQKDNYLLLKYSKTIFNTGWNKLTEVCRGKVINLNYLKITAYPFDKFFNLNETSDVTEEKVAKYIKKAKIVTVTEKMDGSLISVTRINTTNYMITTNGDFNNIQIELAKKLLEKKYSYFYNSMESEYTYIFELIHPEDKHIVDYKKEEKLCLLGVRDLKTQKLLTYSTVKELANKYKLDVVKQIEFTNLSDFIKIVNGEYENKEGFVFRLIGEDFDVMFKLKYIEYFNLHRLASGVSIQKIYKNLHRLEEYIEGANGTLLDGILSTLEEIAIIKEKATKHVEKLALEKLNQNNLTLDNFFDDKEKMINFIQDIMKNEKYGYEIVQYIKKPYKRNNLFDATKPKRFFSVVYPDFK